MAATAMAKERKRRQPADTPTPGDDDERRDPWRENKPRKERSDPVLPSQIKNKDKRKEVHASSSARRRPRSASSPASAARPCSAPSISASSRRRSRCRGRSRTPGSLTRRCAGPTTRSCLHGMMLMNSMQF